MDTSEYLSMGDAARLLGVTKARISQLAASGNARVRYCGRTEDGRVQFCDRLSKRSASEDAVLQPMWDASLR